jgi:pyruvate-formate lyase
MRSRMFASALPSGGLAVFHIRLLPMRGVSKTGTLQVNCAIGKVPAEHTTEGIRLTLDGYNVEFDQEISGRSLFVLMRRPHP